MKTKKYYWKVVRVIDGKYVSCIIREGPFKVMYKLGEFVKASVPGTGLMVFNTRENARRFKSCFEEHTPTIFKVEVSGTEVVNQPHYSYYNLKKGIIEISPISGFPEGTVAFPEVMLVEKSH